MNSKILNGTIFTSILLLTSSSLLLFGFVPLMSHYHSGIPGLEVSFVQETITTSPGSKAMIECYVDTSAVQLEYRIGVGFHTNSDIYGELIFHASSIGPRYVNVTLLPTLVNLGETIEVTITFVCGPYSQFETVYVIVE